MTDDRALYRAQLERLAEALSQRTQPIETTRKEFVRVGVASRTSEAPTRELPRIRGSR